MKNNSKVIILAGGYDQIALINEFKNKNYTYSTSSQITNTDSMKTETSFSSLDFIKYIYWKNFNHNIVILILYQR